MLLNQFLRILLSFGDITLYFGHFYIRVDNSDLIQLIMAILQFLKTSLTVFIDKENELIGKSGQ